MKISKLFHWLYAGLMVMPLFAILSTCCYVAFNKNAEIVMNETSEQTLITKNIAQTNEVNSNDDLIVGNYYKFISHEDYNWDDVYTDDIGDIKISNLPFNIINSGDWYNDEELLMYPINLVSYDIRINLNHRTGNLIIYFNDQQINDSYIWYYLARVDYFGNYFIMEMTQEIYTTLDLNTYTDAYFFFEKCPTEYLPVTYTEETIDVPTYNGLGDVFYYAVDTMNDNPFFAWAHNSFLSSPILYITSLFNMPSNSAIILLLCYWFNISIIWLTFDVMIYVPLVVHRWLDKGGLE